MPRYFETLGAGRPITLGGRSFVFEPVEPMGGSWAGVLAVDDESAASILAEAGYEISAERYNTLKKKQTDRTAPASVPSLLPPQLPPQRMEASASPAGQGRSDSTSKAGGAESADPALPAADTGVTLTFTSKQPPVEPILEMAPIKRKKAA